MPEGLFKSHERVFKEYSDKCRTFNRPAKISGQPFAVLSDIHGNLAALEAVIEHLISSGIPKHNVRDIICLGDVVGYGPKPKECLNTIKKLNPKIWVKGNHDEYASSNKKLNGYTLEARESICWTRNQLNDDDKKFLANLPFNAEYNDAIFAAHGCYGETENLCTNEYLCNTNRIALAMVEFSFSKYALGIFGHTHQQWIAHQGIHTYRENDYLDEREEDREYVKFVKQRERIQTEVEYVYKMGDGIHFLNPGSIGQPRDFEPAAAYAIVVPNEQKIILCRVPYNLEITKNEINKSDIDKFVAEKLTTRLERGE